MTMTVDAPMPAHHLCSACDETATSCGNGHNCDTEGVYCCNDHQGQS